MFQAKDEMVVPGEVLCTIDRVGDSAWGVLLDIRDVHAPPGAVADGVCDRLNALRGVAHDDADLLDPRLDKVLDPVFQNRLVGHWNELLGPGVRQGAQPGTQAAGQD